MSFADDDEEPMQGEEQEVPRSSPKKGSRSAGRSARPGSSPVKGKQRSPSPGRRFAASPGQAAGNFIVNPLTGNVLSVMVMDNKTGNMKYNPRYLKLQSDERVGDVNALHRYKTEAEASAAAKAYREANKAAGKTKSGEAKVTQYYFNRATHRSVTRPGAATEGPFQTKHEAQMWGFNAGLLKKKPSLKTRDALEGEENVRWYIEMTQRNGHAYHQPHMWIDRKGNLTAFAKGWSLTGNKTPKLVTSAEKVAAAEQRSSSARGKVEVSQAEFDRLVAQARAAGVKEETIDKIVSNANRTLALKASALRLTINTAQRGGNAGLGLICLKRNKVVAAADGRQVPAVPHEAVGQASAILKSDGTLGGNAKVYAKEYLQNTLKKMKDSELTDDVIKRLIREGVKAGYFVQTFGTGAATSKCKTRNEAYDVRSNDW